MSKFKAMKFWIGNDPKCSERVQKMLFDMGYQWRYWGTKTDFLDSYYFTTVFGDGLISTGNIFHGTSERAFKDNSGEEINIDWLRTPKEETIELNGKKYIKADLADKLGEQSLIALEEALKHINPVD